MVCRGAPSVCFRDWFVRYESIAHHPCADWCQRWANGESSVCDCDIMSQNILLSMFENAVQDSKRIIDTAHERCAPGSCRTNQPRRAHDIISAHQLICVVPTNQEMLMISYSHMGLWAFYMTTSFPQTPFLAAGAVVFFLTINSRTP